MSKKYVNPDTFAPKVKHHKNIVSIKRLCECANCRKRFYSYDPEPVCHYCYSDEVDWVDNRKGCNDVR